MRPPVTLIRFFARLIAVLGACSPGLAQHEIIRGVCRKDGCDEFSVVEKEQVAQSALGTLYRTKVKVFHASYSGRKPQVEEDGFVLCSHERPAILSSEGGKVVAFVLAPDERKRPRDQINYYALYFGMCHGFESGRAASRDPAAVAHSLGYSVARASASTVLLTRPEDVLAPEL